MPEIDEELGRYLDSLVEPVEPEWVIGWVARRRRRRAAVVALGAVVVAVSAGSIGYALHSPRPSSSLRFGTHGESSSSAASSTPTSVAPSSTSSSTTGRSYPPPTATTTTTAPAAPSYPWPVKDLAAGDVDASLQFSSTSPVSGVPVAVGLTLVNTTDHGVIIQEQQEDLVMVVNGKWFACVASGLFIPDFPGAPASVLPPGATATGFCQFVPGDPGAATAKVALEHRMIPFDVPFTQTPVNLVIAPPPEPTTTTTTTTTFPATTSEPA